MEEYIDIAEKSKSVAEAVYSRHSIREFTNEPIPTAVLEKIIRLALRAPSWKNAQPWYIHSVSGSVRNLLSEKLLVAAKSTQPNPESSWLESYPSNAKKRMFDLGMKVYGVAGIDRKDKVARDEFMLNNFRFFGAPTALILTTTFDFNFFVGIDLGCLVESILLLAREEGLGTCAQAALGAFPDAVKGVLQIPEGQKVVMGISIGYPKADSNLNKFHTPREDISDLVTFYS